MCVRHDCSFGGSYLPCGERGKKRKDGEKMKDTCIIALQVIPINYYFENLNNIMIIISISRTINVNL